MKTKFLLSFILCISLLQIHAQGMLFKPSLMYPVRVSTDTLKAGTFNLGYCNQVGSNTSTNGGFFNLNYRYSKRKKWRCAFVIGMGLADQSGHLQSYLPSTY